MNTLIKFILRVNLFLWCLQLLEVFSRIYIRSNRDLYIVTSLEDVHPKTAEFQCFEDCSQHCGTGLLNIVHSAIVQDVTGLTGCSVARCCHALSEWGTQTQRFLSTRIRSNRFGSSQPYLDVHTLNLDHAYSGTQ